MNNNLMVLESSDVLTMSSLEIAELTGKRHDHVMVDIEKMLKALEIHAPRFSGTYKTARGNEYKCYNLPKRETLILVSGYSVTMRARIIDRWQELEGANKNNGIFMPNFSDPVEAAIAWANEKRISQMLEQKIEEQKPKVEFAETVGRSDGTLSIGDFAKLLPKEWKIGRNKLFKWLRDNKYLMKDNVPYQRYVNEGLFEVIETVSEYDSQDYINLLTLITGKGQLYVTGKLKETLGLV